MLQTRWILVAHYGSEGHIMLLVRRNTGSRMLIFLKSGRTLRTFFGLHHLVGSLVILHPNANGLGMSRSYKIPRKDPKRWRKMNEENYQKLVVNMKLLFDNPGYFTICLPFCFNLLFTQLERFKYTIYGFLKAYYISHNSSLILYFSCWCFCNRFIFLVVVFVTKISLLIYVLNDICVSKATSVAILLYKIKEWHDMQNKRCEFLKCEQ